MKKILKVLILVTCLLMSTVMFVGCGSSEETNVKQEVTKSESKKKIDLSERFQYIDSSYVSGDEINIYYDTETKVMYQYVDGYEGIGGPSVIYNQDGTPMLWNEDTGEK